MSRASHVATFFAGVVVTTAIGAWAVPIVEPHLRAPRDRYRTLDSYAQALSYVSTNYVDPVDERALVYDSIRGMVGGLDPHSSFLSPKRYRRLRQDTEGEFGGVGVTLGPGPESKPPNFPIIDDIVPGSAADRAGLQLDDRVVAVDGQPTASADGKGPDYSTWETRLRGASGTRVELTISRLGWPQPRPFSLVREQVKVPSVEHLAVEPGIGYLAIRKFQEATSADTLAALRALEAARALDVLVLDLRNDPGGLLDQAIQVADLFLTSGTIVTIRGRRGAEEVATAHGPGTWAKPRLIVLVDQQSASAAEIVAGALQDHKRGTVMGLPTYGKGSVQTFYDLDDGSGLKLTTARYYTPSGRSLEGSGITPDLIVEAFEPEVIIGGGGAPAVEPDEVVVEVGPGTAGAAPSNDARIRERLTDDVQFSRAHQTARQWLGSK